MTTLNFDDEEEIIEAPSETTILQTPRPPSITIAMPSSSSESGIAMCPVTGATTGALTRSQGTVATAVQELQLQTTSVTNNMVQDLITQASENTILLHKILAELKDLRSHMEKRWPFSVKTCGFEREMTTKAKELFICQGPWLVQGSLEKMREKIANLLGGEDHADQYQVNTCLSYTKEKFTLWRAEIRKKVLNKKYNKLRVTEFTEKLYNSFKSREEDMRNATKTALLLRKFATQEGYLDNPGKPDFWERFVEFVNVWNNSGIPNKWLALRAEDEEKYSESLLPVTS
ncbi:predicted protein [Nematostella vectensis]|uniref:Uncharacterized protein n=1 Tax=Nematostella vectensis TaxID=45351 RepID=A7S8Z3_NEMVE|nr:uncharacterized protein LOC5511489 [Nematostella vectensis]EDO39815.1 predicted protein [Nematostella vectensis]|eukprot:XP_001631878.1 predicted protein [Nematostella vectensis]